MRINNNTINKKQTNKKVNQTWVYVCDQPSASSTVAAPAVTMGALVEGQWFFSRYDADIVINMVAYKLRKPINESIKLNLFSSVTKILLYSILDTLFLLLVWIAEDIFVFGKLVEKLIDSFSSTDF